MAKRKTVVIGIVIIAIIIAAVAGYVLTRPPSEKEYGEELVVAFAHEPPTFDVHLTSWSTPGQGLVSEAPISLGPEGGLALGSLANFKTEDDGTLWYYRLPKDAKFSNGDPLDAEDLKESIERYIEESPYSSDWFLLEGWPDDPHLEVINETTLKLEWSQYPAADLAALTSLWAGIANIDYLNEVGAENFARKPVFNGPFKVENWVAGEKVVLSRNEYFFTNDPQLENHGPPHIKKVTIRYIPEGLTRASELQAGNVHYMAPVPLASLSELEADEDIGLIVALSQGIREIVLNCQREPFTNVKVRHAISFAINRTEIVEYLDNTVQERHGFLAPSQVCYSEEIENWAKATYGYDPDEAEDLLSEAGYSDGFSANMLIPSDFPSDNKAGVLIKDQLAQVGINVELSEHPDNYIAEKCGAGDYDMAITRYSWADPKILYWHFDPNNPDQEMHWNTSEAQELLDLLLEGNVIQDIDERTEVYEQAQQILANNHPTVPLFTPYDYSGYLKNKLENVEYDEIEGAVLWNDVKVVKESGVTSSSFEGLHSLISMILPKRRKNSIFL